MESSLFNSLLEEFLKANASIFIEDELKILENKFNNGTLLRADIEYDVLNRIKSIKNITVNHNGTISYRNPIRTYRQKPTSTETYNTNSLRNMILGTT